MTKDEASLQRIYKDLEIMDKDFEDNQTVAKATTISTNTGKTESAIRQTANKSERTEQIELKIRYAKTSCKKVIKTNLFQKFNSAFHLVLFS